MFGVQVFYVSWYFLSQFLVVSKQLQHSNLVRVLDLSGTRVWVTDQVSHLDQQKCSSKDKGNLEWVEEIMSIRCEQTDQVESWRSCS